LINIFCTDHKGASLKETGKISHKNKVWSQYFRILKTKGKNRGQFRFKCPNYAFNYQIMTDGFAVSLNLIKEDNIESNENIKNSRVSGRRVRKFLSDLKLSDIECESYLEYRRQEQTRKKFGVSVDFD